MRELQALRCTLWAPVDTRVTLALAVGVEAEGASGHTAAPHDTLVRLAPLELVVAGAEALLRIWAAAGR